MDSFSTTQQQDVPTPAPIRAWNGRIVDLEKGYALGRLAIQKREEFRGPGTRGLFYKWVQEQGYTAQHVQCWMRRVRKSWVPATKCKPYKRKKPGKLKANNGAAYRKRPAETTGFMPAEAVRDLASFDVHGAAFSPICMSIPAGLTEQEWMAVGRKLSTVQGSSLWWVGDWISEGADSFGKHVAYDLAQQATGMGRGSLYMYCVVSRGFSPERRVAELTFKHHMVVATPRLTHAQQDGLLRDAVTFGLSPKQLYEEVIKIVGKRPRKRIKIIINLWPDTFRKLNELSLGKRIEWFAAEIVTDFVMREYSAKKRAENADVGNIHGVDITDEDLPDDLFNKEGAA